MNTQKLIKKLKRLNELTEDALCREWLHKLSDYEHKQFVEKANALKEEIASLEQESVDRKNRTTEQDDKDKTAEEILENAGFYVPDDNEYLKAIKGMIVKAMQEYASREVKKAKDELIEKISDLINDAYQRGYEDRDFDIGYGSNKPYLMERLKSLK